MKSIENTPRLWLAKLPKLEKDTNKYSRGSALIYGGSFMTGAARLAARAAQRMGAGYVSIACPKKAFPIYAASLTSVVIKPFADERAFAELLEDKRRAAFLIGPGAGLAKRVKKFALLMLKREQPIVLDADAITLFKDDVKTLKKAIKAPCVITPHEGEFKRVFGEEGDKLSRARWAAKESGAIIVLKGSDTVIASPDGHAVINSNAPPTLATAGSGDVLSGMITGLLAQGMEPFLAACAAVWMHGEAANRFGPGLIADDLPEMLPKVFSKLIP